MIPFTQNEPLTDAELDRLGDVLKNCKGGRAMNLETLDGFFAALIAGPEAVMPSEYYPEVFGGEISDTCEFDSLDEANKFLGLMMRHWNDSQDAVQRRGLRAAAHRGQRRHFEGQRLGARLHARYWHAQRGLGRTHQQ
jgi:uncharacterized protein YecA (UPF0149 family)